MTRRARLRVAPGGAGVVAAGLVLGALGWATDYGELWWLVAAAALSLALAALWPRVTSPIEIHRVDPPKLIGRGETVTVTLGVSSQRRSPPTRVIDQLAGSPVPIDLPPVRPGEPLVARYRVVAARRGVFEFGPILEERTDPLSLMHRTASHPVVDQVLVHPIIHPLTLSESGARLEHSRARQARLSDDPLSDFRSLREYVPGDDERLIHWPSTAKAGAILVRDHFELRRTTRTVVLETLDRSAADEVFEDAVEIAASLACESLARGIVTIARTRDRRAPGRTAPMRDRIEALELFSRVRRTLPDETLSPAQLRLTRDTSDQIFLVAGSGSPLIAQLMAARSLRNRVVVIRLRDGRTPDVPLPGRCYDVRGAEQFARAWNRGALS